MQRLELTPESGSPGRARMFARQVLAGWGVASDVIQDAELLVTELVTNAVIHARTPVLVEIFHEDGALRFAVSDYGPGEPRLRVPSPDSVTGRGLFLLDRLAPGWQVVRSRDAAKSVIFTLPASSSRLARGVG